MTIRVEIKARGLGETPEAEAATIADWRRELFVEDRAIVDAFTWQNKDGMGFGIHAYSGDQFIGFAHVFARLGLRDDAPVLMGCLGSVMTARDHQGKGVATTTVTAADDIIMNSLKADLGVLVCKASLLPFYQRLGWRRMPNTVVVEQPDGKKHWPYEAMLLLGENKASMPDKLDLCGFPF